MGKVKKELGSDAVILQTRQIQEGGLFGFFGKTRIEITAAVEERSIDADSVVSQSRPAQPRPQQANAYLSSEGLGRLEGMENQVTSGEARPDNSQLEQELKQMRLMLEKMNYQIDKLDEDKNSWSEALLKWADWLREFGIDNALVKRILDDVQANLSQDEIADEERVRALIEEKVAAICAPTEGIQLEKGRPRVVALIGPTGVGKTTTIGKLAAGFSIVDKRKVALITVDTYRVAAVEQIKTFGEIIGVPVEVAMTPSGLRDAILQHSDKELIFVDTAGRSPHHELHMSELRAFLEKAQPDQTMLVLSATTQQQDQLRILERFKVFATHLIFTKLDETITAGPLLGILDQTDLPTAYVAYGQNVPDDIEIATPQRLARQILKEGKRYV